MYPHNDGDGGFGGPTDRGRFGLGTVDMAGPRGGMAERPIAPALKAGSLTASWVRIPVPPASLSSLGQSPTARSLGLSRGTPPGFRDR